MRFLVITLILVAVAQAKNFQKRDDFFDIDNTKDTKNSDNTDSNYDQSIPDFNIQPKKSSDDQFSNDGDYLEEADEDFTKPVRLAAPAVRKAKKPLQVDSLRTKFVAYLNLLRRLHAASPLLLHGPLTVGAQKWANNLVKAGKVAYDKATTHNQTICVVQKQQDDAIRDCSASLQARGMNYDWAHKKVNKDNKDFVIVVDRRTTHVGVGISRGPLGKVYIVAFYSPRVNEKALIEDILPYTDVFAAAKGAKCQTGYTLNEGTCYKFHKDKKNWMGAVFECAKESAVLTDVPSAGAEKAIKAASAKAVTKHVWFGLNDRINEGMYSYVAGDPVSHLNWKTGEPQGKNQNCVALELKSTMGSMADLKCTDQLNFVCKKPLEGHVLYQVEFEMPALNYQKEFSDQASDPRQKLNTQIESGFKVMAKTEKTFVKIFIIKVSDGSPKPKAVAAKAKSAVAPVHKVPHTSSYYSPYGPVVVGKKRDEISPTATAMPSSSLPSPTVSSSDSFDDKWLDSFDDKSKGKKTVAKTPPKKTKVVAVLKFGVKNIPADPTLVLQDYLKKNKGRSAAPLGQAMKILAVKLLPPGSEPVAQTVCDTVCASTCAPTCSPNCCFQQPSYSPYQAPCGSTTYNPCAPPAPAPPPPPAPKPKKPKVIYAVPQPRPVFHVPRWQAPPPPPKVKPVAAPPAPCTPSQYNPCATPAYQYGAAPSYQPAYSTYGAPPMAPPVAAPCTPTPLNPCQPPAAPVSIQGHVFGKRSIKGPGAACGVPPLSPCAPPMGMPMPMQPPMMPPMLPPMGAPCGAPPANPCAPPMAPPMPPPMLPAPCGAPPANPCAPPMAPPMPPPMLPPSAPCGPPMNPCAPPMAPPMPPPMLPPPAPCGPPMNPCAPPMAPPMPYGPMPYGPMPYGPMPFGGPCTPPNPCAKKPKAGKKAKKGKKSKKGKKGKPFRRCGTPPFAPCNGFGFAPPMPMPMLPPMGAPCGAPMNPCAPPMAPPMPPPMLPPPAPCGPPMNPCAPPMAPPMLMPMPMPFAPPCAPSLFKPCPPPKAAKKPAVKKPVPVKAPSAPQPVVIAGVASPFSSGFVLPAPPPPYIAPPPMVQFTGASPCFPGNPCAKRGPIMRRPKQAKSKKPVARTVTHIQPNQQSYGGIDYTQYNVQPPIQSMPFNPYGSSYGSAIPSPLGMPLIPGMTYPKCLHNPTNPCKPLKFKTPKFKPVLIKLKSTPIEIKVPQNPNLASLMNLPVSNQCQQTCMTQPSCPTYCSKRCCMLRGKRHD